MVYGGAEIEVLMARPRSQKNAVRLSVSLDPHDHLEICRIAADLNLSAAWLVRRAVSEFVVRYERSAQAELPLKLHTKKSSH